MRTRSRRSGKLFAIETRAGEPVRKNGTTVIPFATSYRLVLPVGIGGFVYNRPTSVYVSTADGQEQTYPIQDVTRIAQIAIWGAALAIVFIFSMLLRGKK